MSIFGNKLFNYPFNNKENRIFNNNNNSIFINNNNNNEKIEKEENSNENSPKMNKNLFNNHISLFNNNNNNSFNNNNNSLFNNNNQIFNEPLNNFGSLFGNNLFSNYNIFNQNNYNNQDNNTYKSIFDNNNNNIQNLYLNEEKNHLENSIEIETNFDSIEPQYKNIFSLKERKNTYKKINEKYPNKIPIICEKHPKSKLNKIEKTRFLINNEMTLNEFKLLIEKYFFDKSEIYIFINDKFIHANLPMKELYNKYKDDDDNFLYCFYSETDDFSTFNNESCDDDDENNSFEYDDDDE